MQNKYERLLESSNEHWEDFTTGRKRKNNQTSTNWHDGGNDEPGGFTHRQLQHLDSNGKPIWKGSGTVKNYVPAWERSFKKSMMAKQQRMEAAKHVPVSHYTPMASSDKHPPVHKQQEPSTPVMAQERPPRTPVVQKETKPLVEEDDDSPLKFTVQYGHEP